MKWRTLLCLALGLSGLVSLNGRVKAKPESILIHSEMQLATGISLDMVISSKEQKYIRAAIHNDQKTVGVSIVLNKNTIQSIEESNLKSSVRTLKGEDAASNLLDLIALNPDYHFSGRDAYNFKIPIFEGYRIELENEEDPIAGTERYPPIKLLLYKVDKSGETLIRSIEYISFFENTKPYLQPKEIIFTDEETSESGRIIVHKVEYDVGLPNFLFKLRDETEK